MLVFCIFSPRMTDLCSISLNSHHLQAPRHRLLARLRLAPAPLLLQAIRQAAQPQQKARLRRGICWDVPLSRKLGTAPDRRSLGRPSMRERDLSTASLCSTSCIHMCGRHSSIERQTDCRRAQTEPMNVSEQHEVLAPSPSSCKCDGKVSRKYEMCEHVMSNEDRYD